MLTQCGGMAVRQDNAEHHSGAARLIDDVVDGDIVLSLGNLTSDTLPSVVW